MLKLKSYATKTHQGPYLEINEDDVDIDLHNGLFLILDGFGGSNVGNKAVELIKNTLKKFYTKIGGDPDSTLPFFYSHKYLIEGNALINSMHYAHDLMKADNESKPMNEKGGASAIAAAMAENIMTLSATGNCLAYLYRKGKLETILVPDSLRPLAGDEYINHYQTSPVSGFGLFEDLHLQIRELRLQEDDLLVLMTDGAYSRLKRKEIKFIIDKQDSSDEEKIEEIFKTSNARGNLDNQSTIFLRF
jgi:serine/threonine protein phosphatase PrpC